MDRIKVKAPATIANLVCGFDVLGLAVQEPFDEIEVSLKKEKGIRIRHTDAFGLPEDPAKNIIGVALQALVSELKIDAGFEITVQKNIMPGSGVGSSAASAAGVIAAVNLLLETKLSEKDQVRFAMEGEAMASGARHADNLAPCIFGGVTLIRDTATLDIVRLSYPALHVSIVHPQIEVKTSYAREILPKEVPLKTAVSQWAQVAGLVAGFLQKDLGLIGRSLHDHIIEPVRSRLIPGYDEVMKRCRDAGVIGGGISGSGPSLFMLCRDEAESGEACRIMKDVYDKLKITCKTYRTGISERGVSEM